MTLRFPFKDGVMITVIGDVHGKFSQYADIIKGCDYSVQLGDMGFNYHSLDQLVLPIDPMGKKHVFFGGNHDNYDLYPVHNSLGDYGLHTLNGVEFYYVRGAFSIDGHGRDVEYIHGGPKTHWTEEQLTVPKMSEVLGDYQKIKPDTVITHSCPKQIADMIGNPDVLRAFGFNPETFNTNTQDMLQVMFEIHQPKLWIFGHFHRSWDADVNGTHFACLGELETLILKAQE